MIFYPANISLPDFSHTNAEKWAVIACDQFTSEPAYWEACDRFVGDAPSTLRMILPEAWLGQNDGSRAARTAEVMRQYEGTVLREAPPSYIYVERTQPDGRVRAGLVGMVDLEDYDYAPASASPIRATEGTVLSRIPPRVAIRQEALYELPHILLLSDDPEDRLLAPYTGGTGLAPLYDTPLMLGGGHIRGWRVSADECARVNAALTAGTSSIVLAVGDGNHSLAAAKAYYEEQKQRLGDAARHSPARYALAEVTNLHSPALDFSPIYRLVTCCEPEKVACAFEEFLRTTALDPAAGVYPAGEVTLVWRGGERICRFPHGRHPLTVGTVQAFLDEYPALTVDYIHDEGALRDLARQENAIGFLFSGMEKSALFPAVEAGGPLPKKTFSMGHARDKRYYMEARKLI